MHELAIANSVLDLVRKEAQLRPGARVTKICMRVGDLAGLDSDAFTFCFEALIKDTDLSSVTLEIERKPQRHRCPRCGNQFSVIDYETACSFCGEEQTIFISGDELEVACLEMEES